jgi:hypothetical protein
MEAGGETFSHPQRRKTSAQGTWGILCFSLHYWLLLILQIIAEMSPLHTGLPIPSKSF